MPSPELEGGHEAARVHHASRRCGGYVAARCARAAASDACDGLLGSASLDLWASRMRAFHQGLSETGYVEGQNVTIEYRWAEGRNDRLPALATDPVRHRVTVIVAPAALLRHLQQKRRPRRFRSSSG